MTLKTIIEINKNLKELKKMEVPFVFDIAKILSNNLVATEKIIQDSQKEIELLLESFYEKDEYGNRCIKRGVQTEYNEKLENYYQSKEYKTVDGFKYISIRDFKVREDYKSMKFNIKTMELLNIMID